MNINFPMSPNDYKHNVKFVPCRVETCSPLLITLEVCKTPFILSQLETREGHQSAEPELAAFPPGAPGDGGHSEQVT